MIDLNAGRRGGVRLHGSRMSRGSHHTKLSGSLGAMERTAVIDAVKEALSYAGHTAENELHPEMPTGPPNLVPDNSLERRLLGWEPAVSFRDGLHRTIDWYYANRDRAAVSDRLDLTLTER